MQPHKDVVVLSIGGSILVPDKINLPFLTALRDVLYQHRSKKFVIVPGGGSVARHYIAALKTIHRSEETQAHIGILVCKLNALLLRDLLDARANKTLPKNLKELKQLLKKHDIVVSASLRFAPHETSDGTAASIAHAVRGTFINITNVPGLYTKDPQTSTDARLIPEITARELKKRVDQLRFHPGQHFVIDQHAAADILKHKIPTVILGPDLRNLDAVLHHKPFIGTRVVA